MRTRDAVTPMPGLITPFLAVSAVYLVLAVVVAVLLRRHVRATLPPAAGAADAAGIAGIAAPPPLAGGG
jgi:biopolymer transport protein ExbD